MPTQLTPGKYYNVATASGSTIMKLLAIKGDKATLSTYDTFGYNGTKKPAKVTVLVSQIEK